MTSSQRGKGRERVGVGGFRPLPPPPPWNFLLRRVTHQPALCRGAECGGSVWCCVCVCASRGGTFPRDDATGGDALEGGRDPDGEEGTPRIGTEVVCHRKVGELELERGLPGRPQVWNPTVCLWELID